MNNRKTIFGLAAIAILVGGTIMAVQGLDSSQSTATAGKCGAPESSKSQPLRRFPRVAFPTPLEEIGKMTFVLQTTFPSVPTEVRVYKVQPVASKKEALLSLFENLPLSPSQKTDERLQQLKRAPKESTEKEKSFSASIGDWHAEIWNGGQFSVQNFELSRQLSDSSNPSPAPTPEEAHKAADDFLAKIGPLPFPVQFSNVVTGEELIYGAGDKPGDRVVTKLNVVYTAEIDGISVYGPVGIQVGAGPVVVCMTNRLREAAPDKNLPILSAQEAFDKLRAGEAHMSKGPFWASTANVKSIMLVYWQETLAADLSYIMPVFVFEGDAVAEGKPTQPWAAFVDAVRPEFLETPSPLESSLKRPVSKTMH